MDTATRKFTPVEMPVGYYEFHPVPHMNFQINRWHSSGGYDKKTAEYAGKHIQTFDDWTRVWKELGQKAEADGELRNAAFCYRAAEFFTDPNHPEKTALYDRFIELFYTVHNDDPIETHEIPYGTGALHALRVVPPHPKGIFVIHGGGDSFAEEFLPYMIHWYNRGYEVINFEGPGQGSVIHKHGLGFEWQWEHCTKAVLDYFKIEECAFMGISFGGWFCIRAAAHEPRIYKARCV